MEQSNQVRIMTRLSGDNLKMFKEEVKRQKELFGAVSESEVAARLIFRALSTLQNEKVKE